jgi:hypothetical protein
MANVRSPGWRNMFRIKERVEGARVAPASPRRAREAISISAVLEKAAMMEVTPKAAAPMRSRRLRPMRSPRVPMVMSDPETRKP